MNGISLQPRREPSLQAAWGVGQNFPCQAPVQLTSGRLLLSPQKAEPEIGWKLWFSSQYSPTFSHCKPILKISGTESCDDLLHSLHFFKRDWCPPLVNFFPTLTRNFLLRVSPVPSVPKPSLLPRLVAHLQHQGPVLLRSPMWGPAARSGRGPGASAEWSEAVNTRSQECVSPEGCLPGSCSLWLSMWPKATTFPLLLAMVWCTSMITCPSPAKARW